MSTKKPIVQCVMDEDIYKKLLVLCKKEERTASKKGAMIISEYVRKYEETFGEIPIE